MAKDKKQNHFDINMVFEKILQQNPQIIPGRIQLFSEVYYPIAILEIEMKETTFEDFELVPLSVLKFISCGLNTSQDVAQLMGLSASYVQKVMDLLMGYAFIDGTGITNLGREALRIEKKVVHSTVRQRFQADALTGDLLKIEEQPLESDLNGMNDTFDIIPHMPHIEGVSVDAINSQLMQSDVSLYKKYKGSILHANVDEITDVSCVDLEYVKAFLVKMQGLDSPFVLSYSYDSSKKKFDEIFKWQPMRLPGIRAYTEYGFSRDIKCYSAEAKASIDKLYGLICKNIKEIDEKRLKKILAHVQPFDYETMDISMGRIERGVPDQIVIYVNSNSFLKWNTFVLTLLEHIDPVSGYLYTNSWLNGLFIRFESQSAPIKMASKLYKRMLKRNKKRDLNAYIRKELFKSGGGSEPIRFQDLIEVLNQYETDNTQSNNGGI